MCIVALFGNWLACKSQLHLPLQERKSVQSVTKLRTHLIWDSLGYVTVAKRGDTTVALKRKMLIQINHGFAEVVKRNLNDMLLPSR